MSLNPLIEESLKQKLGFLTKENALVVKTGSHTGRAADSRYIIRHLEIEQDVDWGSVNKPLSPVLGADFFTAIKSTLAQKKTYEMKGFVGCFPIEVTSSSPWHIAFAQNMFRSSAIKEVIESVSEMRTIRIYHAPHHKLSDLKINLRGEYNGETLILLDIANLQVGIIGTAYAGEIKKSAFSMCNFLLPKYGIFPMHSSANCRKDGSESCVLFGLSGTGKTTLSADYRRALIGDDEIIWTKRGLSNLEGGCYAKLINLSQEAEPEIWQACHSSGAILENVVYDDKQQHVNFADGSLTENTRGSYDISAIANVFDQNIEARQPKTIVFLTADAFGALPAVARLNSWQAQYHFMSGYTAKVAGTEMGIKEPKAAFSACFGAPFMPRHPAVYARLLAEKVRENNATVWILNTGWVGGYQNGKRFPISVSRKLLELIQSGELNQQEMVTHPVFGFEVPKSAPGVDSKWLALPNGPEVKMLAAKFRENFTKFEKVCDRQVVTQGGPMLGEFSGRPESAHATPSSTRFH